MLKHNECETREEMTKDAIKRTDQDGKGEPPYREICLPHLNDDDTEQKRGYW